MMNWVLLLRGINVGGRNRLTMDELKKILQKFNFSNIKTYIQSGNVIFQSEDKLPKNIEDLIADEIFAKKGFRPLIFIIKYSDFLLTINDNPFPEASEDPKSLHFHFLSRKPDSPDIKGIESIKNTTENYKLTDHVFYLHAPEGIGRSKLAANVEKYLNIPVTARNWRTIQKLKELVDSEK